MQQLSFNFTTRTLTQVGRLIAWINDDEKKVLPLYDPKQIEGHIAETIRSGAEKVAVEYRGRWFMCYAAGRRVYTKTEAHLYTPRELHDPKSTVTFWDLDLYELVCDHV
jgi:hypothetical protein